MKLFIKYMVSLRCKMVVRAELEKLGLIYTRIDLGEVVIKGRVQPEQLDYLKTALLKSGLKLMDNQKAILIEKIKNVIVEMVHYSETTGITIQNYIITHKIERAKELLLYDELNLTEISYRLNYSSVAHLSNQFKKVTGLTPTFFKQLKHKRRTMLDHV